MGFEMVEIVMKLEEELGIELSDEDCYDCRTVGDMHRLLCAKLGAPAAVPGTKVPASLPHCETQHVFYGLRQALTEELHVPRRDVRPGTRLGTLVGYPQGLRHALALRTGWHTPPLPGSATSLDCPRTVGELARDVQNLNPLPSEETTHIWDTLRWIVIDVAMVQPEEITPEARFWEDLDCG